jgi:aspartokinase/homoserine dehydrogenase 1
MEIDEIENESLCPQRLKPLQMKLFESLQEHAEHFESIYKEALSKESRLKYVAQFKTG